MKNKEKVKVLIIIENNLFFVPEFITSLLQIRSTKYFFQHAFLINKVKFKQNINFYMIKNFINLKFSEKIIITFKIIKNLLRNIIYSEKYNLEKIFKKNGIETTKLNKPLSKYKQLIKKLNPDLILNSGSLYVKKELLKLPKYGFINRHSSMLPAGGGFFPVFYAIAYNEPIGTTIHRMSEKIDKGVPLAQKEIKIDEKLKSLFEIYELTFKNSPKLIDEAIKRIIKKKNYEIKKNIKPSYRSFPDKQDWKEFRKKNIPWI